MQTQQAKNPPAVRITAVSLCEVHHWQPRLEYPVLDRPVNIPDDNGYEIYIESCRDKRPIWLSSSEYEVIS